MTSRLDRLHARLAELEAPAVLLTDLTDLRYLSGFAGSAGVLLVAAGVQVIITDFRYRTQVAAQAPDWEFVEIPTGTKILDTAAQVVLDRGLTAVGFQADHLTHANWERLSEKLGAQAALVPLTEVVAPLRQVKEPGEIAALERAAAVADATMEHAFATVRAGQTEREVKAELDYFLVTHGATKPSFDMIVAGGPNSALPHAPASDRPLQSGDLVTFDLGAVVDGYCSDLTRTVVLGQPTPAQRELYALVYRAQTAALAAVRPGVENKEIDAVARDLIAAAGHADEFGHGLGHSLGLSIHEEPRFSPTSAATTQPGHVMTVEPGVYLPGVGGVRLEDLVVITETGCRVLSHAPKPAELLVLE